MCRFELLGAIILIFHDISDFFRAKLIDKEYLGPPQAPHITR